VSGIIKGLSEISTVGRSSIPAGAKGGLEGRSANTNRGLTPVSQAIFKKKVFWIVMSIMFAIPRSAFACAACTGRSDDAAAQGINAAVLTLLIVYLGVLGAIVSALVYLIRRAAKHPLVLPGVPEAAQDKRTIQRIPWQYFALLTKNSFWSSKPRDKF